MTTQIYSRAVHKTSVSSNIDETQAPIRIGDYHYHLIGTSERANLKVGSTVMRNSVVRLLSSVDGDTRIAIVE